MSDNQQQMFDIDHILSVLGDDIIEIEEKLETPCIHQVMTKPEVKADAEPVKRFDEDDWMINNRYTHLRADSKNPGESLEECEDIDTVFVFFNKPGNYPTFYAFDDIDLAQTKILEHPKPCFSAVLLRNRPIKCHLELDIEKTMLENVILKNARHKKALQGIMKALDITEAEAMVMWIIEIVKERMTEACVKYGLDTENDWLKFFEAHDFKRADGKKSVRLYTRHFLPNYAHYANWRRMVKDSLPESIKPMLDEHSFGLRMPGNWKGDHKLEWVDECDGAMFVDGVPNYVEGCTALNADLVDLPAVEHKEVDLDGEDEMVKDAVELCKNDPHIEGDFEFACIKGAFIQFKRIQPSVCPIHERVHDMADCFATVSPEGHVRMFCYRGKVAGKSIYVGFVGKTVEIVDFDTSIIKKRVKTAKALIKANKVEQKKRLAAAAKEAKKAAKAVLTAKTKEEKEEKKALAEATKEALKAEKAVAKENGGLTEEQVEELKEGFEEEKKEAVDFPENKQWQYKDRALFADVTLASLKPVNEYIKQTVFKMEYSGSPIWATANTYRGKRQITLTSKNPFSGSNYLTIRVVNPDYDASSPGSKPTITFEMDWLVCKYRNKHFHECAEFMPYLKPEQNVEDTETLNLFEGFEWEYEEEKFDQEPEVLAPIFWHIRNILANGNAEVGTYIINWLAYTLQQPAKKAKVALLFKSDKEQAGKNIFFENFAKHVLGERWYIMLTNMDQLTGGFNNHLRAKKFVLCNELANYAGYKASETLKTIITDEDKLWTKKGIDSSNGKDYANLVFLTNNPNTVRIGLNDRRYLCCDISNDKVDDAQYFKQLVECFEKHGEVFFQYLANLDLSQVNITKIPMTAFKQEMMWDNIPNAVKFMAAIGSHEVKEDEFLDVDQENPDVKTVVKNRDLFNMFKRWAAREEPHDNTKPRQFTLDLANVLGMHKKTVRIDGGTAKGYSFSYNSLLMAMRSALKRADYTF